MLFFGSIFYLEKITKTQLYEKNQPSNKKLLIAEELTQGKSLTQLASELGITLATAEVFAIDCLAPGRKIAHEQIASFLALSTNSFQRIKVTILSNEDNRLRTIRDSLMRNFLTIRFVLSWYV